MDTDTHNRNKSSVVPFSDFELQFTKLKVANFYDIARFIRSNNLHKRFAELNKRIINCVGGDLNPIAPFSIQVILKQVLL